MKTGRWLEAQRVAALVAGLLFVVLLIALYLLPAPTPFQSKALSSLLALLGAFIGYIVPGSLALSFESPKLRLVRAAGALAVFALCYFFLPSFFH